MTLPFHLPFMKKTFMPNKPVELTALGKKKTEEMMIEGPKYDVMAVLNEHGPCSINEIAQEINKPPHRVHEVIKELMRNGYVSPVSIAQ